MKKLFRNLGILLGILIVAHIVILLTGNDHLYPTLQNTILKGRFGPEIDEFTVFANREVKTGAHQPWARSVHYNQVALNDTEKAIHQDLKSVAFVVIHRDSIVAEHYWEDYNADSRSNSFSMAKSLVSMAIGAALTDGYIQSLDQKVSDFLPEFKAHSEQETTIRDLLKMSSGINFDEHYVNPFAYPARANYGDDLLTLTMEYEQSEAPNNTFNYLSGNSQLLAMVIKEATGQSLSDYFSDRIWKPVGAKNPALWSLDHEGGYEKAFCCFNSNALDFARIGKLYLNRGIWLGDTLVPPTYVDESTNPVGMKEKDGTPCTRYGYQWWLTDLNGKKVFYARGILGQYILVCPELELVVVRLGHKRIKPEGYAPPAEVNQYLQSAFRIIRSS